MGERPFGDTSERGVERLICTVLTGAPWEPGVPADDGASAKKRHAGPPNPRNE
ncbi:MAG: hypothetical protein MUF66_03115 [Gammaproteobacteria bacterium]|jgi:hypothetical protein|nr:hypothetical protein [Gammaproteobacteria bacterium]